MSKRSSNSLEEALLVGYLCDDRKNIRKMSKTTRSLWARFFQQKEIEKDFFLNRMKNLWEFEDFSDLHSSRHDELCGNVNKQSRQSSDFARGFEVRNATCQAFRNEQGMKPSQSFAASLQHPSESLASHPPALHSLYPPPGCPALDHASCIKNPRSKTRKATARPSQQPTWPLSAIPYAIAAAATLPSAASLLMQPAHEATSWSAKHAGCNLDQPRLRANDAEPARSPLDDTVLSWEGTGWDFDSILPKA